MKFAFEMKNCSFWFLKLTKVMGDYNQSKVKSSLHRRYMMQFMSSDDSRWSSSIEVVIMKLCVYVVIMSSMAVSGCGCGLDGCWRLWLENDWNWPNVDENKVKTKWNQREIQKSGNWSLLKFIHLTMDVCCGGVCLRGFL